MSNHRSKLIILILVGLLLSTTLKAQETQMVPVQIDGKTYRLEMRIYKPKGEGPFPTVIFNHGSTGSGRDERIFERPIRSTEVVNFFIKRGWAIVLPARRGRAGSEGLYDEGFRENRSLGYTCEFPVSVAGADRALRDVEAAIDKIIAMPFVDSSRLLIGGNSRGGILSGLSNKSLGFSLSVSY